MHRDVNAVRGVEGARSPGDESHARFVRELAMRFGHHRRTALVTADDILDSASVKRVQYRQEAFARNRKYSVHTKLGELFDKYVPAGSSPHIALQIANPMASHVLAVNKAPSTPALRITGRWMEFCRHIGGGSFRDGSFELTDEQDAVRVASDWVERRSA